MDVRCCYILSVWLSFHLLTVSECAVKTVHGFVGQNVILPCRYDASYRGSLHSCWGRGPVPNSGCSDELISSDGSKVTSRKSERYQLQHGLKDGDVSLTIIDAQESDAGTYGCRVHVPGWFNDQKETVNLVITRAPVPTQKAPESQTNAPEQATKTTWTTHNHTRGPQGVNSTGSSEASIAQNTDEAQSVIPLAVLVPVSLLLLLALVIVFLIFMRKRWKKASEMLGIPGQQAGVRYRPSESSLGLNSREIAEENIYQIDEDDDY